MRRKRTDPPTPESEPEQPQYIGFITTPIADRDLERTKRILTRHGVRLEKIPTPDNWWTLFLPDGSTKTKQEMEGEATRYIVQLPDGYCFGYRAPVFKHDKSYDTLPKITVLDEEEV
jgi:hypothetical protein